MDLEESKERLCLHLGGNMSSSSRKDSLFHKAGDILERLGEKITNTGAKKVGKAIYNAGNRLEHMGDGVKNKGK